jgi:hypothetical protein
MSSFSLAVLHNSGKTSSNMKRALVCSVFILSILATRADVVIQQRVESTTQNGDMSTKIKGDKIRVDIAKGPAGSVSKIMDLSTGVTITLRHEQKIIQEVSADQMKKSIELMDNGAGSTGTPPILQDTGKSETVEGYDSEVYSWTNNLCDMGGTVWVAKDFPNYIALKPQILKLNKSSMVNMAKGMMPDTTTLPGMIVKSKAVVRGEQITTTLISAREEPVDDSVFDAPVDYQK